MISRAKARQLRAMIEKASVSLDDSDALEAVELFPTWQTDTAYEVGIRVRYGEKLYRCEQAHTSQADWTPDVTPALWTEVAAPGEIPVWKQPTGAQDAYMTGDKVHYPTEADPVYISTVDNNVWAPGVYGWEVVN
ncbi:MAG: alpha-amylase [Clostridia bacterium]|nr:alpha-amylase [Clostridia bacterium]